MKQKEHPTQTEIKEALSYNMETGIFTWRKRVGQYPGWNNRYAGKVAGSTKSIYVVIEVNKDNYRAHRLAWIYVYGDDPFGDIDHINGDKRDNRIANLRVVDRSQNMRNYLLSKNNMSGVRGVTWNRNCFRWESHIKINHEDFHLGVFKDFSEAVKARYEAEIKHGFVEYQPESTAYQYLLAVS